MKPFLFRCVSEISRKVVVYCDHPYGQEQEQATKLVQVEDDKKEQE